MKKHEVNIYNLNIPVDENKDKLANSLVRRGFFKQDLSLFKEI
jgi:SOS response regulatory protein OraA/RecX